MQRNLWQNMWVPGNSDKIGRSYRTEFFCQKKATRVGSTASGFERYHPMPWRSWLQRCLQKSRQKSIPKNCADSLASTEENFLTFENTSLSEYPAVVSSATVGNLELPKAPLKSDSYWYRISRVRAVVVSLAELLWIKRSIISVRAEIWACEGSRLALIFSSTKPGANLVLLSSLSSFVSASISFVTSFSCADITGCVVELYEVPLINVLNLLDKLIQSATSNLWFEPIYLMKLVGFLQLQKQI